MSDDYSGTKRVDDMLIIRMEEQPIVGVAWEANDSVNFDVFFHSGTIDKNIKLVIFFVFV